MDFFVISLAIVLIVAAGNACSRPNIQKEPTCQELPGGCAPPHRTRQPGPPVVMPAGSNVRVFPQ